MTRHDIRLTGPESRGARISSRVLSELTNRLTDTAVRAVRLAAEGRSNLQGRPGRIAATADFDILGLSEGSTVLMIEQRSLSELAPDIFTQLSGPSWQDNNPYSGMSALGILQLTIQDVSNGNTESDRLDENILLSVHKFRSILELGFDTLTLYTGSWKDARNSYSTIDRTVLDTVDKLRQITPPNQRIIASGTLDELAGSKRTFIIKQADGSQIRGILPSGDPADFARYFGQQIVVDGEAVFRPSGQLSHLVVTGIHAATENDAIWENVPIQVSTSGSIGAPRSQIAQRRNQLAMVRGKWPGNESDEELVAALEEIS